MRTLKTLAAFGALLLVASGANASISFTVSAAPNIGAGQEVQVAITLTNQSVDNPAAIQFDWLLNGGAIPGAAVQPGSTAPPGGGPGQTACTAGTAFQFQCNFTGAVSSGTSGSNTVGQGWLWSVTSPTDGSFSAIGHFTFTDTQAGNVSIGNCVIPNATTFGNLGCSSNSIALTPVPEPTAAALLGLGLFGLVLGGRRR